MGDREHPHGAGSSFPGLGNHSDSQAGKVYTKACFCAEESRVCYTRQLLPDSEATNTLFTV